MVPTFHAISEIKGPDDLDDLLTPLFIVSRKYRLVTPRIQFLEPEEQPEWLFSPRQKPSPPQAGKRPIEYKKTRKRPKQKAKKKSGNKKLRGKTTTKEQETKQAGTKQAGTKQPGPKQPTPIKPAPKRKAGAKGAPAPKRRKYTCGICHQQGHNKLRCPRNQWG